MLSRKVVTWTQHSDPTADDIALSDGQAAGTNPSPPATGAAEPRIRSDLALRGGSERSPGDEVLIFGGDQPDQPQTRQAIFSTIQEVIRRSPPPIRLEDGTEKWVSPRDGTVMIYPAGGGPPGVLPSISVLVPPPVVQFEEAAADQVVQTAELAGYSVDREAVLAALRAGPVAPFRPLPGFISRFFRYLKGIIIGQG